MRLGCLGRRPLGIVQRGNNDGFDMLEASVSRRRQRRCLFQERTDEIGRCRQRRRLAVRTHIGRERPRTDGSGIVARNVGDDEAEHRSGCQALGQAPALDQRHPLAHIVASMNVETRAKQPVVERTQLGQCGARRQFFYQRRRTARQQHQHVRTRWNARGEAK